jgi:hypothetical protein
MEELAVNDFNLSVGQEFWLRSTEANIQLEGDVRVNKRLREYRVDGVWKRPAAPTPSRSARSAATST